MRSTLIISGLAAASLTLAATADITSVGLVSYSVTAEEFGGASVTVNVQDLYLYSDNAADVALNVYDLTLAEAARVTYYQSATGAGWAPTNLGGMFDTSATRLADSFVTIGGFMQDMLIPEQAPGMGAGTGLDPNFGGNGSPSPNAFAGWYNGSPRISTVRSACSPVPPAWASSSVASPTTATSTSRVRPCPSPGTRESAPVPNRPPSPSFPPRAPSPSSVSPALPVVAVGTADTSSDTRHGWFEPCRDHRDRPSPRPSWRGASLLVTVVAARPYAGGSRFHRSLDPPSNHASPGSRKISNEKTTPGCRSNRGLEWVRGPCSEPIS